MSDGHHDTPPPTSLKDRVVRTATVQYLLANNIVKYGKLALNEMRKLDEATGAPIDFERKELQRLHTPSLEQTVTAPFRLAGWLFRKTPTLGRFATLPLRMVAKAAQGTLKAAWFAFNPRYRNRIQAQNRMTAARHGQDEYGKSGSLSPRHAFKLALDRLHEYQVQAFVLVAAPAATATLGTVGYYLQNNSLDVVNSTTLPLFGALYGATACTAAYMKMTRFNLARLETHFNHAGETGVESLIASTEQDIKAKRFFRPRGPDDGAAP